MHTSLNITYIYLILHENFNYLYCTPLWAWECCVKYKVHLNRVHLTTPLSSKPPRFVAVLPRTNGVWSVDSSNRLRNFVSAFAMTHCKCTVHTAQSRLLAVTGRPSRLGWQCLHCTADLYRHVVCACGKKVNVARWPKTMQIKSKRAIQKSIDEEKSAAVRLSIFPKIAKRGNFKLWNLINVSLEQFP